MLKLINERRDEAGVDPVVLGDNIAAQLHAESSLENCTAGHWDVDGLKPYMRYSLAGGYQSNGENARGRNYCIKHSDWYTPLDPIKAEILSAMNGWMHSTGHRENILDPSHKKVNIGLAWDTYNFWAVQHFEGDYVEYDGRPSIEDDILTISGKVKNGIVLKGPRDLAVQLFYDPPPQPLTPGQLARTYCYDLGHYIAALRPPAGGGGYYSSDTFHASTGRDCVDPYQVPSDAQAPRSVEEDYSLWLQAQARPVISRTVTVPWITALHLQASGESFSIRADISNLLDKYGSGVYSIMVWGYTMEREDIIISEYSIFYGITLPDTYD